MLKRSSVEMRGSRLALIFVLVGAAILAAPALATAATSDSSSATAPASHNRLTLRLSIKKFKTSGRKTIATGIAKAQVRGLGGPPKTISKPVTLIAQNGRTCRILTLVLDELDLDLLGLNVHLDRVELRITGERRGGILGRLFCSLARARVASDRNAAVKALNSGLRDHPIRPIGFTVPVSAVASQAPGPTCQVLDLVLGPLHLDLLGLIVDLNRVHLAITATRGGGVLGDLFCSLASRPLAAP